MIPSEILKQVRRIEIATRKAVNEVMAGEYHSVFKGRGMDFEEVREYQEGDEIRSIDWNVSARMGHPFVKRFKEERELTVMLVVDASGSGEFGSRERFKGELAVELCALLAFSAIKNNDRVGLIVFTDQVEKYVPPKKGRKHALQVVRDLLYFKPERRGTDVGAALEYLNKVIKRRAVTFLVSDFQDDGLRRPLMVANRRHDLVAFSVRDPRERELPPIGLIELEDAETGETALYDTFDPGVRRMFRERFDRDWERRRELFKQLGVDHVELETGQSYVEPLIQFFRRRAARF